MRALCACDYAHPALVVPTYRTTVTYDRGQQTGCGHWLALSVRWSFRRTTNRRRFWDRPISICSCSTRAAGHGWRVPSLARDTSGSRTVARRWCLGAGWSQDMMPQIGRTHACRNAHFRAMTSVPERTESTFAESGHRDPFLA
jgi:hypothetical protein